jgi:hypothetical protein
MAAVSDRIRTPVGFLYRVILAKMCVILSFHSPLVIVQWASVSSRCSSLKKGGILFRSTIYIDISQYIFHDLVTKLFFPLSVLFWSKSNEVQYFSHLFFLTVFLFSLLICPHFIPPNVGLLSKFLMEPMTSTTPYVIRTHIETLQ